MSESNGVDEEKDTDEILSLREAIRLNTSSIRYLTNAVRDLQQDIKNDSRLKIPLWTHVITMIATIAILAAAHITMLGHALGNRALGLQNAEARDK